MTRHKKIETERYKQSALCPGNLYLISISDHSIILKMLTPHIARLLGTLEEVPKREEISKRLAHQFEEENQDKEDLSELDESAANLA